MKQFWHWMQISAAAMVVVCLSGLLAIWVVPRSVWAVVLPSALLVEPEDEASQTPGAAAALPTNTARVVVQAPANTPTLRAAGSTERATSTPGAPSPTPSPLPPTPTLRLTEAASLAEAPTPTLASAQPAVQTMYVCGYERCRDADEYGELIFETEIEVWASSDPNDDRVLYTVSHDQEVRVVREERVWEGPGGLWLELESGGWMSDFWLTAERCTPDNLEASSFADCVPGETLPPTSAPAAAETPAEAPSPTEAPSLTETPTGTPVPTSTETPVPTETSTGTPVPTSTETPVPTDTPTDTPVPTSTGAPTATPTLTPAQPAVQTMYVCGYERCRDADEYGELIFETDIEVWASSDPNDDRILYTVSHDQEVRVVREERVWEGPGGLWLELESGGWMSDFWLTAERCTPDNLEANSFTDCLLGEY